MLAHDLRQGIIKYIWVYIALAIIVFWGSSYFYQCEQFSMQYEKINYPVSGIAMLMYILQGNERYVPNPENTFQISMIWLLPFLLIGYIIYAYPVHDLKLYGYNYMIRTKSRWSWWLAKIVWMMTHILISIITIITSVFVSAWIKGEPVIQMPCPEILESLNLTGFDTLSNETIMAIILVMQITILGLSMIQMLLSFVWNPFISYVVLILIYVGSVYSTTWTLPGNFLMLQRLEIISGDGILYEMGFVYMLPLLVLSIVCGRLFIRKYDIF